MKKRLAILAVVIAMIVSLVPVSAFATGEDLEHSGWSSYSYYTNDYVEQRYDNHMWCTYAYASTDYMRACPVQWNGDRYIVLYISQPFKTGETGYKFYLDDYTYVRYIHLRILNVNYSYGVSTYTHGIWELRP